MIRWASLAKEQVDGAISIDSNPSARVVIDTDDLSFSNQDVSVNVSVDDVRLHGEALRLDIRFTSPPPQFDRTGFQVDPVTCSEDDATWSMPLPPILHADTQVVTIEMAGESELFTYSEEEQTVFLASEVRPKILSGLFCPAVSEVSLEFLLTSDILGKATEIISIPFKPYSA